MRVRVCFFVFSETRCILPDLSIKKSLFSQNMFFNASKKFPLTEALILSVLLIVFFKILVHKNCISLVIFF